MEVLGEKRLYLGEVSLSKASTIESYTLPGVISALPESNERLQVHLKERMHSLEEKNHLSNELERTKKKMEDSTSQKVTTHNSTASLAVIGKLPSFQSDLLKELQKAKLETENIRRQMLQQEIHHNIQQTEALTRNLSPQIDFSAVDGTAAGLLASGSEKQPDGAETWTATSALSQTAGGVSIYNHANYGSELSEADAILNAAASATGSAAGAAAAADAVLSPTGHADAQTLACMLQEQLDAINNEIRLIQEEKVTTEARAEELESRVGSVEHMNLLLRSENQYGVGGVGSVVSTPSGAPPQPPPRSSRPQPPPVPPAKSSYETSNTSPPRSGRSTPKVYDPNMQKYHTVRTEN